MMAHLLMPKATAVWLIDNTSLTFEQIAVFCRLHLLEVEGIANGDVAQGIKGQDPIVSGQILREELKRCQEDSDAKMEMAPPAHEMPAVKRRRAPRYTPVSRRRDRPDAIAWLLRYHPELLDSQIGRLVGTTTTTIKSVRDRTHWNSASIKPVDPVTLGLCGQLDLDHEIGKANKRTSRAAKKAKPKDPETAEAPSAGEETAIIKGADIKEQAEKKEKLLDALPQAAADPQSSESRSPEEPSQAKTKGQIREEAESAFSKLKTLRDQMKDGEASQEGTPDGEASKEGAPDGEASKEGASEEK